MKKIIHRLVMLFLGSLVVVVNATAGVYSKDFFVIKVKTDNIGSSGDTEFTLPVNTSYNNQYNYNIYCDNDNYSNNYSNQTSSTTCTYNVAGTYTILVAGANGDHTGFPAIKFYGEGDNDKILEVVQWGTGKWQGMEYAFKGASYLTVTASDRPDLSETALFTGMFQDASNLTFTHSINDWNTSNIKYMRSMFKGATVFNQDIGAWDVSRVGDMRNMFEHAHAFNQDLGDWDILGAYGVVYITDMFLSAEAFNQDIGDWDVSGANWGKGFLTGAHSMSTSNYDNLLDSWSKLNLQQDVNFITPGGTHLCLKSFEKQKIIDKYNWSMGDDGIDCEFYITTPNKVCIKSGEKNVIHVSTNYVEDPSEPDVHYFIVGGTDKDKFTMNQNGDLSFNIAPDVNNPTDKNSDNVYRVQVKAENIGYTTDYKTIRITVKSNCNVVLAPVINYLLF